MAKIDDTNTHLKKAANRKLVFAISAVVIGSAWLLRNLGILDGAWTHYLFSWQMLLIVVGTVGWTSDRDGSVGYMIMIFVGGFWLLYDIYHWRINFWEVLLPSILIVAGVSVLLKFRKQNIMSKNNLSSTDVLDSVAIFGSSEVRITSQNFSGGQSTAIFGGSDVDFSKAELAPGKHVVDVTNIFGGTTIVVPSHWNVKVEVTGILGAFSDNRKNFLQSSVDNDRELIIRGIAVLGGGELKSY